MFVAVFSCLPADRNGKYNINAKMTKCVKCSNGYLN